MSRRRASATKADISRCVKAVIAAGLSEDRITGVRVASDGSVCVLLGNRVTEDRATTARRDNEWDVVLPQ